MRHTEKKNNMKKTTFPSDGVGKKIKKQNEHTVKMNEWTNESMRVEINAQKIEVIDR